MQMEAIREQQSAALQADSPSEPPAILTSDKIDFNSKAVTRA